MHFVEGRLLLVTIGVFEGGRRPVRHQIDLKSRTSAYKQTFVHVFKTDVLCIISWFYRKFQVKDPWPYRGVIFTDRITLHLQRDSDLQIEREGTEKSKKIKKRFFFPLLYSILQCLLTKRKILLIFPR